MSDLSRARITVCPDCDSISRRDFIKTAVGGGAAVVSAASMGAGVFAPRHAFAAAAAASSPETLVASLYKTLTDEQRKLICFPFNDPLRLKVDANWHITKKHIGDLFNPEQMALVRDIFTGMHSPEYVDQVMKQVEHDGEDIGGFKGCAVALFGEPGKPGESKFEFVLTGRHVTRRCDGNSVDGAAFGGPIFYGHAAESFNEKPHHPGNVYWYQAKRANEVFQALDGRQRTLALRTDARKEQGTKTVELQGAKGSLHGVPVSELSRDQKELVRKVMADVLAPFRKADADEAMKLIEADGGFDRLHLSFYNTLDIGNDGVWDVWQIEGPSALWYFRGAPHVHTWVHIREQGKEAQA